MRIYIIVKERSVCSIYNLVIKFKGYEIYFVNSEVVFMGFIRVEFYYGSIYMLFFVVIVWLLLERGNLFVKLFWV